MTNCKLKYGFLLLATASILGLSACETVNKTVPQIVPTTGVISEADEAMYAIRYDTFVKAYQSGLDTTIYDTEADFGQDLTPIPLERGTPQSLSQSAIDDLNDYARAAESDSFVIYENGKVVSEQYSADVTAQTYMNSKSLAKPLGTIAVGRAIEQGYIKSLDQSVADFIVEWQGTDKAAITINHVLSMRTGLLPQGIARTPDHVLNRAYLHPRHDEVIIHEYPLVDEPGTRYEYSNANSELVTIIISRATGMAYEDWLIEQVFKPLGMDGGKVWMNREGGVAHSGCCIGLPSESYLKLAILVLQNGQWDGDTFLSEGFIESMTTPTEQNKYAGMGIYVGKDYMEFRGASNPETQAFPGTLHSEPYVDKDIMLFDGNGNQVIYIMPSRSIVAMRLGSWPPKDVTWDNSYIPNLISRSLGE